MTFVARLTTLAARWRVAVAGLTLDQQARDAAGARLARAAADPRVDVVLGVVGVDGSVT